MESKKQNKYTFLILENVCLNFPAEFDTLWLLASLISGADADLAALNGSKWRYTFKTWPLHQN